MTYLELGPIYALLVLILGYLLRQARASTRRNKASQSQHNPSDREVLLSIDRKLEDLIREIRGIATSVAQLAGRTEDIWNEVHDGGRR